MNCEICLAVDVVTPLTDKTMHLIKSKREKIIKCVCPDCMRAFARNKHASGHVMYFPSINTEQDKTMQEVIDYYSNTSWDQQVIDNHSEFIDYQ